MGDTFSGGRRYRKRALEDLGEAFGPEFVAGFADQKPGSWAVRRSRHGLHVVRVDAKAPAEAPSFDTMRGEIEMAYDEKRKSERLAAAIADLRKKYAVE
jgi:parvulin-like peptidyl-prolyl isomerase